MSWPTIQTVRAWTAKRKLSLRGLVGAAVETTASFVPVISIASKLLGELAACGVDRLASADEVPGLKPAGAAMPDFALDQIEAWLTSITRQYGDLLDKLEARLPTTPDNTSSERLAEMVRECVESDADLARRFDEHLVEARRQTLSLGLIEVKLDEFAHGQRQMWASLEEIKDLFASLPGAAEMSELRRVQPEALRAIREADDLFLAGRRDEAVQKVVGLLKLRGVGEATLARHATPRLCGLVELTPAARARLRFEAGSAAARTVAAVSTFSGRAAGLKVWRSLPRGFAIEGKKYRVEAEIGRGGMASVYRAVSGGSPVMEEDDDKVFAIKVPAAELLDDPETAKRFFREVKIAKRLSRNPHDNIVRTDGHVEFTDPHDGHQRYGLVLEYVEGQSLAAVLAARKETDQLLQPDEIYHVLDKVCEALKHAHSQQEPLLHRDVKPANVLLAGAADAPLTKRAVKLMDFGIARVLDEGLDDLTRTGVALGTRHYMPPEFECEPPRSGFRSDVYLLGVLLREMLTGHPRGDVDKRADCPEAWVDLIDVTTRELERKRPASVEAVREQLAEGFREWKAMCDGREVELRNARAKARLDSYQYADAVAELEGITDASHRDAELFSQAMAKRDRVADLEAISREKGGLTKFDIFSAPLLDEWATLRPDLTHLPAAASQARKLWPKQIENSIGMKFVIVPAGKFMMGSPNSEIGRGEDEGPQHEVTFTRPFGLGVFPVTVGQFRAFVRVTNYKTEAERGDGATGSTGSKWERNSRFNWTSPGFNQTDNHPVTCVSWNDAREFLNWLSETPQEIGAGRMYRLPTEAEWEYSCRGGTSSYQTYPFYSTLTDKYANFGQKVGGTTPQGCYPVNEFGLSDMVGNIWEWCSDWYGDKFYQRSPPTDPVGPHEGSFRVNRGSSWYSVASNCRSAQRSKSAPGNRNCHLGFRVAVGPSEGESSRAN